MGRADLSEGVSFGLQEGLWEKQPEKREQQVQRSGKGTVLAELWGPPGSQPGWVGGAEVRGKRSAVPSLA